MNIRIDSVNVKGLGPIANLDWAFKDTNLIYGRNEQGKTFLVEYILRSLFRQAPKNRDLTASGQVLVSGLADHPLSMTPDSRPKLEDFILETGEGLPVDLARLCVVKGGELSFDSKKENGVSKTILKEYLSDQRVLDTISKTIPTNVSESSWNDGVIVGGRATGLIKARQKTKDELAEIDELLDRVDSEYSSGAVAKAKLALADVNGKLAKHLHARRIYAYDLSQKIKKLELQLEAIPEEAIEAVKSTSDLVEGKRVDIKKIQSEIDSITPQCVHYNWLRSAIDECEKRPGGLVRSYGLLFTILTIVSTSASVLFAFLQYPLVTLGLGLAAIGFAVLAFYQYKRGIKNEGDRQEVVAIFDEFETRFAKKIHSMAALKSALEEITPLHFGLETRQGQLQNLKNDLANSEKELARCLSVLAGKSIEWDDPVKIISLAKNRRNEIIQAIQDLNIKLASSQVTPEEYINEKTQIKYDQKELENLVFQKDQLRTTIEGEESQMGTLKQLICSTTYDPISMGWEDLIEHLQNKRLEVAEEYKQVTADIGGGIILSQVITELRQQEDLSILNALSSSNITEPIRAITHRYTSVELEGDELIVTNPTQRFYLSDLSTGAQEQILLALRIGIASHILLDKKPFLILDDAFQHSDWERREWLVDEVLSLAKRGWQIIYFTMDDHIRHLFETRIQPKLKCKYGFFELASK